MYDPTEHEVLVNHWDLKVDQENGVVEQFETKAAYEASNLC